MQYQIFVSVIKANSSTTTAAAVAEYQLNADCCLEVENIYPYLSMYVLILYRVLICMLERYILHLSNIVKKFVDFKHLFVLFSFYLVSLKYVLLISHMGNLHWTCYL